MKEKLVSILLPVYNVEQYLDVCFDSIINQTYKNIQIVAIDDGSLDNSWNICQKYAKHDKRIEIYHQENHGVSYTRNELLKKIKGDYFLFVDSDDWLEIDAIEFLLDKIYLNDVDIVICSMVHNDKLINNEYKEKKYGNQEIIKEFLFHKILNGSLCNKLISKSSLHNISFHNNISYGEDALFIWELLQRVESVLLTNKQLYHYRKNNSSISHQRFGEKKLSGHETWRIINEQVSKLWPIYTNIAKARWGVEDMYLLRSASLSNYTNNDKIKMLQSNLVLSLKYIKAYNLLSKKEYFNAYIISRWFGYWNIYYFFYKIVRFYKDIIFC